jgi:hypothetical protein
LDEELLVFVLFWDTWLNFFCATAVMAARVVVLILPFRGCIAVSGVENWVI